MLHLPATPAFSAGSSPGADVKWFQHQLTEKQIECALAQHIKTSASIGTLLFVRQQMPLPGGGLADICTLEELKPLSCFVLTIYEVKKRRVGIRAVEQLVGYLNSSCQWRDDLNCELSAHDLQTIRLDIQAVLVGQDFVDRPLLRYFTDQGELSFLSFTALETSIVFTPFEFPREIRDVPDRFSQVFLNNLPKM